MKRNPMLAKIEAKYDARFRARMDMLLQMGQDAAIMAAHDTLGMGPGRAGNFLQAYIEAMNEMARMIVDDQQDDKEFIYAKAKIDGKIKAIVGEKNFIPWEERHGVRG